MSGYPLFTLDAHRELRPASPSHFRAWYANLQHRVCAETKLDDARVVTLFLGMNWGTDNDPTFFLTTIHGGRRDGDELRAGDYATAIENHTIAVSAARGTP